MPIDYPSIEDGVVKGYKKIEDNVVGGYKKVEDSVDGVVPAGDGNYAVTVWNNAMDGKEHVVLFVLCRYKIKT